MASNSSFVFYEIIDKDRQIESDIRLIRCYNCIINGKMFYGKRIYFTENFEKEDPVAEEDFFKCEKCGYEDLVYSSIESVKVKGEFIK